ncbi:FAD-dependent oxidoreductase domain-containing protein 2-like [Scylla paramamosain]|uniref:FAD-dependent oxidoreductase domain-containing protein 2-like n=1 Tax=Scylla paramamosain TaxID=85552 RepID=UPI00308371B1
MVRGRRTSADTGCCRWSLLPLLLLPLLSLSPCLAVTNTTSTSSSSSSQSDSSDSSSSSSSTSCSSPKSSSFSPTSSSSCSLSSLPTVSHDYCVIGAGPAGLQMGYFLHTAGRDYLIFERANHSGSFFSEYPRHRRLISINKRYTGKTNAEFNLRHDWNSLLSHDPSLLFKHFSSEFFPEADTMVRYLGEFAGRLGLRVKYNTVVQELQRHHDSTANPKGHFSFRDQHGRRYSCRTVVMATGMSVPSKPNFPGAHYTLGYEKLPLEPAFYEGKNVLILGRGNAAFETADAIYGSTNMVHMVSRSRARLSWNTHYVGDLRAVNNGLLDTYQLKSLDGLVEASVEDMVLEKQNGLIYVQFPWDQKSKNYLQANNGKERKLIKENHFDNFCLREGYDIVLRCLGFKFDFSIFSNSTLPGTSAKKSKYPAVKHTYEAQSVPGLYFAGTATHSLDYRRSAGGFIHGFRYTVRALHRLLEWRLEGRRWPVTSYAIRDLLNVLLKRMNEASGPYQMFGELADVVLLRDGKTRFELLEEFPVHLLAQLEDLTGREAGEVVVMLMEYGPDFSGPEKDTFRMDRSTGDPLEAHRSNFLHPVLYYYKRVPTEAEMMMKWDKTILPKPERIHHVLEDFLTLWTSQQSHILPLRRFLEYVTGE